MISCQDPQLREMLPTTNSSGTAVLNSEFSDYDEYVSRSIECQTYEGDEEIKEKLLRLCQDHTRDYSRPISNEDLLVLIHPLYMHLRDRKEIRDMFPKDRKSVEKYLDDLFKVFKSGERRGVDILIVEDPRDYASATSLLLEKGLVNGVLFTEEDYGYLAKGEDLLIPHDKNIFIGGGYNGRCLSSFIRYYLELIGHKRILAIRDLVVNKPRDVMRGKYQTISCDGEVIGLDKSQVITLHEFYKRIKNARKKKTMLEALLK